ncbi:1-deoxy-D-xylulose-5-phosphate synthase [Sphingobacterium multivorum]|uniref:1-deoxy-D-xylulose-5-phosphate synthase n=2 Tax=Sphingobacteriaceae TaxID=84566 RepID=UPI0028ACD85A|nr:1-deoxy-D-xylulose-5-phosphate synthase [Sphingobacterium multivorum]
MSKKEMTGNYQINSPSELRALPQEVLPELGQELRNLLIDHIATHGGHFSSSLGVVELTIAIHYVFNTPEDKLIWDVGHQAYVHKLITGRAARFHSNRLLHGISGFPVMEENNFDAFGTGHSSTSLSAILGMACAARYKGDHNRQHIAVIGDGAMTAGLAFEALNNIGFEQPDLLIILNDNNMSIDAGTGALQNYLTDLTSGQAYNQFKSQIKKLLSRNKDRAQWSIAAIRKIEKLIKTGLLASSNIFEALGIRYFGPVDGHNLHKLIKIFEQLKHIMGPKIVHCVTQKGKGFAPAMLNKAEWHATGKFDKLTGERLEHQLPQLHNETFQQVLGETLTQLARRNSRIMAISPAMLSGSRLTAMKQQMPNRVFDVGICEQHAVTFSAGLAADGLLPFCFIYSTFLQRAYDQLIHDVALQKLPVVFCIDRAGVVGPDGPTHQGAFDIAFLRCIPNITGASPMTLTDFKNLLFTAQDIALDGPFAIRYPKGRGNQEKQSDKYKRLEMGKGRRLCSGKDIALLSLGPVGQYAQDACCELLQEDIHVGHYDLRFFKPLDEALLHEVFQSYSSIITIEDGCIAGGVGTAVLEFMVEHGYSATLKRLGLPDSFAVQGTQQQLHQLYYYDKQAIIATVRQLHRDTAGEV